MSQHAIKIPFHVFEHVAKGTSLNDPRACNALLEGEQLSDLGHTGQIEVKYGISREDYPRLLKEFKSAFQRVTGYDYHACKNGIAADAFLKLHFADHVLDPTKMAIHELDTLRRIVEIAWRHLNMNEFSVITSRSLFRAQHKLGFQTLMDRTGKARDTIHSMYFNKGRKKLLAAIATEAPELADHPFVTNVRFWKLKATKPVPSFNAREFVGHDRNSQHLLAMSDTLFEADDHYISVHCVLADPSHERDYTKIADTLGMSEGTVRKRVVAIREKLNEAISFENVAWRLKVPNPVGKSGHVFEGKKYTTIDESLMDLDLPAVRKLYDTARHATKTSNALFVFCATHLYRAEAKLSYEEIEQLHGITIPTSRSYASATKRLIKAILDKEESVYSQHPLLRTRECGKTQPFHLPNGSIPLRGATGTDWLDRMASSLFSHRQYYTFSRIELGIPAPSRREFNAETGIIGTHIQAALENGRRTMLEALRFPDVPDRVLTNPIVKRWLNQSSQILEPIEPVL